MNSKEKYFVDVPGHRSSNLVSSKFSTKKLFCKDE